MDNQLKSQISEAQKLKSELADMGMLLAHQLSQETLLKQDVDKLNNEVQGKQNALIVELESMAKAKRGPLDGLAKTSPAYKAAIAIQIDEDKSIYPMRVKLDETVGRLNDTKAMRQCFETQFSSLKYQSQLQVAILNALS